MFGSGVSSTLGAHNFRKKGPLFVGMIPSSPGAPPKLCVWCSGGKIRGGPKKGGGAEYIEVITRRGDINGGTSSFFQTGAPNNDV